MAKGQFPGGGPETPIGGSAEADRPRISEELIERAGEEQEEMSVGALEARIAELEAQLESAHEALDSSERRAEIDRALTRAEALDLETARMLTEAAVASMGEADVERAVEELRARKPFLFARPAPAAPSRAGLTMRPASTPAGPGDGLAGLAEEARSTGDRRVLLQYLRQRRGC